MNIELTEFLFDSNVFHPNLLTSESICFPFRIMIWKTGPCRMGTRSLRRQRSWMSFRWPIQRRSRTRCCRHLLFTTVEFPLNAFLASAARFCVCSTCRLVIFLLILLGEEIYIDYFSHERKSKSILHGCTNPSALSAIQTGERKPTGENKVQPRQQRRTTG